MMEWFIFAILSAILFGVRQVSSKKVLMYEHATEYLTATCLVAFLFTLFFVPFMNFNYSWQTWGLMYLKGLLLTIGWLLGSKSLRHLEISYATPLTNMTPIFVLIIGVFFLEEVPSIIQIIGVLVLIFAGYWLQTNNHIKYLFQPLRIFKNKYSVYMIIGVIFYSFCAMLDKIILKTVDTYTTLSFTFFVLSVHYVIIQFYKYDGLKDIKFAFSKGKYFIIITALLMVFSDVFYYIAVAIPGAMISLIIPIKRMSTLVATLIGGRMFHDKHLIHRAFACVLMILGAVLIVVG